MFQSMVDDVAGKTVDVKVDRDDGEADRWVTDNEQAWYIQPWMLTEYYDRIKKWGKCRPEPFESDGPGGKDIYRIQIISRTRLEELVEQGIVKKEKVGDSYYYIPVITDMGTESIPDTMAEQLCGRILNCTGTGTCTTWVEQETENKWIIAPWMLDVNYGYLLNRKKGCLDTGELEDEEEEPEKDGDSAETRNHVDIVGEIVEITGDTILVSTEHTDVLVHYVTGDKYKVGQRVNVAGHLVRTSNMMGYPEIDCVYIKEV